MASRTAAPAQAPAPCCGQTTAPDPGSGSVKGSGRPSAPIPIPFASYGLSPSQDLPPTVAQTPVTFWVPVLGQSEAPSVTGWSSGGGSDDERVPELLALAGDLGSLALPGAARLSARACAFGAALAEVAAGAALSGMLAGSVVGGSGGGSGGAT